MYFDLLERFSVVLLGALATDALIRFALGPHYMRAGEELPVLVLIAAFLLCYFVLELLLYTLKQISTE
jgi:hypothetical protein